MYRSFCRDFPCCRKAAAGFANHRLSSLSYIGFLSPVPNGKSPEQAIKQGIMTLFRRLWRHFREERITGRSRRCQACGSAGPAGWRIRCIPAAARRCR
ncbi:hypothetical protein RHECNPAF_3340023 [Rhizobium etli CNPAF512]|nr:hypothetical protein RHECNPAF_3340023 [Rhizobium etli CNPAF512]